MTERLSRQLSVNRELKGERCPGEEQCARSGPLFKYRGRPIETVCSGCNLRHTKPERSPLVNAQNTALELEELQACGAVFSYPEALTPYQWACRKALYRARQDDEAKEAKKREAKEAREGAKK